MTDPLAPEALEAATVELLRRLITFDTVNPPGNEGPLQAFLEQSLTDAGFDCVTRESEPGRPNLVARLDSGVDGPTLGYLGHVDTVLADASDWSVDPWLGEVRDDCVWGRGALDMKGQVAAELAAAIALVESGWRPAAGALLLVLTADEEAGGAHGAKFLCERHPDLVRCDLLVNEGGGERIEFGDRRLYAACVAEKGVFRFDLTTIGRAGHASVPRIGVNSLTLMAPFLQAMAERQPGLEMTPEPRAFLEALGVEADDPVAAVTAVSEVDPRIALLLEPMLGVTITPTRISASQKINVIPARTTVGVDCRALPGMRVEDVRERVVEVLGVDGYELEFRETIDGNRSPLESTLMDEVEGFVAREDAGARVAPIILPGFTDSRWFRRAFPECVAYGFCPQREMDAFDSLPLVHGADERVPVVDLGLAARFFVDLAQRILA